MSIKIWAAAWKYLTSKGHRMTIKVTISLHCTSSPSHLPHSKRKCSDNYGLSSRLDKVWTVTVTEWPWMFVGSKYHIVHLSLHLAPHEKWKGSDKYGQSSSLDNVWTVKVTGWPWKLKRSKCDCVTHLHHHIFLPYQNEKAVRIRNWAATRTRFVL